MDKKFKPHFLVVQKSNKNIRDTLPRDIHICFTQYKNLLILIVNQAKKQKKNNSITNNIFIPTIILLNFYETSLNKYNYNKMTLY